MIDTVCQIIHRMLGMLLANPQYNSIIRRIWHLMVNDKYGVNKKSSVVSELLEYATPNEMFNISRNKIFNTCQKVDNLFTPLSLQILLEHRKLPIRTFFIKSHQFFTQSHFFSEISVF